MISTSWCTEISNYFLWLRFGEKKRRDDLIYARSAFVVGAMKDSWQTIKRWVYAGELVASYRLVNEPRDFAKRADKEYEARNAYEL